MQVYYNDIDPYCCKVLRKNTNNGNLPGGFVDERDIRDVRVTDLVGYNHVHLFAGIGGFPLGLKWANFPGNIRILIGGFPCQDISVAGKRVGITGERSGLWSEMYRIIQESFDSGAGYDYICIENVAALLGRGLDTVLSDLAKIGIDAEWTCLRASDFGAPHLRERIFIVAYPNILRDTWQKRTIADRQRGTSESTSVCQRQDRTNMAYPDDERSSSIRDGLSARTNDTTLPSGEPLAHAAEQGLPLRRYAQLTTSGTQTRAGMESQLERYSTRATQPPICGMFNGLSARLDKHQWPARPGEVQHEWEPSRVVTGKQPHHVNRLKALGNAIVPQCAQYVARCIMDSLECQEVAV